MEALLRWDDPERGLVQPDASSRPPRRWACSAPIGAWVFDALAAQIAAGTRPALEPRVSFNVSPRELHRPDFAAELRERAAQRTASTRRG